MTKYITKNFSADEKNGLVSVIKLLSKIMFLIAVMLLFLPNLTPMVHAVQEANELSVSVFIVGESSLIELLEGKIGQAYLVYYPADKSFEQPMIVVRLTKQSATSDAVAEIFDTPKGANFIPVEFVDGLPVLPDSLHQTVVINAIGGWWQRENQVNYNLDIIVYGQVAAMWGATLGEKAGWTLLLEPNQQNAQITVRDTNYDGIPDWDWRTMLPDFPNRGDYRTNYAERKCDSPVIVDLGFFPEWPFITVEGSFEQVSGMLRPPIVVDMLTGKIKYFSELVTVRHQNCSYALYSINRVLPNQMNSPDFETPFAFYDLTGKGSGYPNLIIRTGRSNIQRNIEGLALKQMEVIRYSWSNEVVGDGSMDYKVELFGFHPYDYKTAIADGGALIDAPPFEILPDWVIDKFWPVVTFIDVEDVNYLTSEGIYEWGPGDLGNDYYLGETEKADTASLADIRIGLRGEYRLESNHQSELYMSPIDHRLHLKWAEHGIWRLNNEQIIRVDNLDNDETIDVWSREIVIVTESKADEVDILTTQPEVIEKFYALAGHFLHTDGASLTLVANNYEPMLFETLPPTDHDSWEIQRTLLAPYEAQRRDPMDLHTWLDAFPGPRSEIAGTSLAHVRITDDGFRFELTLEPGYRLTGPDLLGLMGLAPGDYLVENNGGSFTLTPLVPAQLRLDLRPVPEDEGTSAFLVNIFNTGTTDASNLTLVVETIAEDGTTVELSREPTTALAGEAQQTLLNIPSVASGAATLRLRLEDAVGQTVAVAEATSPANRTFNRNAIFTIWQIPVLLPILALFGLFVAGAALLAITQHRGKSSS